MGEFLLAHILFMKLPAGPLVRYRSLCEQFSPKKADLAQMSESICLLIQGAAKQVILGVPIQQLYTALSGFSRSEHSVFSLWQMPLCHAKIQYFTLNGYFYMERALRLMLGVALPQKLY